MNEAPKKIWVANDVYRDETPYIRADLVDGLVEALKWIDNVWAVEREYKAKARAALKALEEE
jgi:hypothetical protein